MMQGLIGFACVIIEGVVSIYKCFIFIFIIIIIIILKDERANEQTTKKNKQIYFIL